MEVEVMNIYRTREFLEKIKISKKTLENYEAKGLIVPIRAGKNNKSKFYTDDHIIKFLNLKKEKKGKKSIVIAYARVSSNSQKKELKHQIKYLETFSLKSGKIVDEYLTDIGSGINFKRKNLQKIINMVLNQEVSEVIVTYKDRLARFAFDLLEWLFESNGCKITVINIERSSPHEELVEDLMSIIHVFSVRLYGLRQYKQKIKKAVEDVQNEEN